jgi:hypothetical protein
MERLFVYQFRTTDYPKMDGKHCCDLCEKDTGLLEFWSEIEESLAIICIECIFKEIFRRYGYKTPKVFETFLKQKRQQIAKENNSNQEEEE